ncbi:hypothetical protein N1496_07820 [Streptococcus didelphis]|uniref:Uncharacterized protein n=1 Tax=Streptococcus didelphis TaxID=102886 RepID=A0ABY9LGC0_9STRE|nr:hypothetical protein [Streptococcus didelphis]WMB27918.1 hypothetical protein N1496_07820 [Streptococcus didelphis]
MNKDYMKPFGAALTTGIIMFTAYCLGEISLGTLASLGGFSFWLFKIKRYFIT